MVEPSITPQEHRFYGSHSNMMQLVTFFNAFYLCRESDEMDVLHPDSEKVLRKVCHEKLRFHDSSVVISALIESYLKYRELYVRIGESC